MSGADLYRSTVAKLVESEATGDGAIEFDPDEAVLACAFVEGAIDEDDLGADGPQDHVRHREYAVARFSFPAGNERVRRPRWDQPSPLGILHPVNRTKEPRTGQDHARHRL